MDSKPLQALSRLFVRFKPSVNARLINLAMLVLGYGFGQGSIFIVQTWLLAKGHLELLAQFGTHFAFATLGTLLVEAGSLTTLARHTASLEHGRENANSIWQAFWETSIVRAAIALGVLATATIAAAIVDHPFSSAYMLYASPAFVLWAVSASGLLDGLHLSGVSGATASLPYAASAIALLVAPELAAAQAGALLGMAFSVGYLLTVLTQFAALRAAGWSVLFVRPSLRGVRTSAYNGLILLGGTLPGQLYFRVQLLICSAWLGPAATALLIYVKQIVVAVTQLIGFVRRVEFPALVHVLRKPNASPRAEIWRQQRGGTYLSVVASICMASTGAVLVAMPGGLRIELGLYLIAFAPTVISGAVILGYAQGLAALGRYAAQSLRSLIAALAGTAASFVLVGAAGVYGFAIADIFAAIVSILALNRLIKLHSDE